MQFWVPFLKHIGNTRKSNMKMGKILTLFKKITFNVALKKIQPQIHRDPITQVMEFRSAVLGAHSESPWFFGKIEHENGLKFGLSSYINN